MKKLTSIAIAFLLVLSIGPAMAADQTGNTRETVTSQAVDQVPVPFEAFRNLPAMDREALTPLTETELAAIEGSFDLCVACLNLAIVTQTNTCVICGVANSGYDYSSNGNVRQSNDSDIHQRIN